MNMPFLLLSFFDDIRVARVCIRVRGPYLVLCKGLRYSIRTPNDPNLEQTQTAVPRPNSECPISFSCYGLATR